MTIKTFWSSIQVFFNEENYYKLMPKGFSEEEKKLIRKQLIEIARDLFSTYGLRKTNIEEITNAVNIAKGSFYTFYNSKEELFLDVFKEVEKELIKEMSSIVKSFKKNPKEKFQEFIYYHIKIPKEHPIIQQVSDKSTRTHLIRKLKGNEKLNNILQTYDYISEFIKEWQAKRFIIDEDPEIIAGVLKSVFTLGLDDEIKAYIGKDNFPKIIDKLISIITEYFVI